MKILCACCIFLLACLPLTSQQLQRMITDFKGVATNGTNVLCYGDYGIITYTTNFGRSWQQLTLGDKYSINSITAIGKDFVGATQYSLIKSINNGLSWTQNQLFDTPEIIDMAVSDEILYVLTRKGVWTANSDLKLSANPVMELDSTSNYAEMTTDGENVYIVQDDRYLLQYSIATQTRTRIRVISLSDPSCLNCIRISDVQLSGGSIYAMVNAEYGSSTLVGQFLVKSEDNGKTWKKMTASMGGGNAYKIVDNHVYFIRPSEVLVGSRKLFATQYKTIDSSHFTADSSYFTVINDKDSVERDVYFSNKEVYGYTGMITVNTDTMIAVGSNKLISASYDGGKSWRLQSFFTAYMDLGGSDNTTFISKDRAYILNFTSFYTTSDGGVTWLPQKHITAYPQVIGSPNTYFFSPDGKGYVRVITRNNTDTNVLATEDYGETYRMHSNDSLFLWLEGNVYKFSNNFRNGLDAGNITLYAGRPIVKNANIIKTADYNLILRYDTACRLVDSVRLDVNVIESMAIAGDGSIYCLALKFSGENNPDSAGITTDYRYSYYFLKSSDKGKTWDSIAVALPVRQKLIKSAGNTYRYTDVLYGVYASAHDGFLLYPTSSGVIYRFDYMNNLFDSLQASGRLSNNKNTMFTLGLNTYVASAENNALYYINTADLRHASVIRDSLRLEDIFTNWTAFDQSVPGLNEDAVLSVQMLNDSTGFMLIGLSGSGAASTEFAINVVKLMLRKGTTGVEDANTDNDKEHHALLWNSPPYPLPGGSIIASCIYWNDLYDITKANITVHSANGTLLSGQNITMSRMQNSAGLVQWDATDVVAGVYIIKISLAGEEISLPVVIVK